MDFEVGGVYTGKVTGITKFGAFVQLAPGKSGLVHISEIANTYVKDVNDHLENGQEVKVKILSRDDNGRLNLSISKAAPAPEHRANAPAQSRPQSARSAQAPTPPADPPSADALFEQRLKQFMQTADNNLSGNRMYADRRSKRGRK